MSKEELFKKYQEILLKTNGGVDDYVIVLCQISNLIKEYAEDKDQQITDLQKQLTITEKALELACKELHCELENPDNELYTKSSDEYIDYFKTKAKEMMKSE